MRALRTRHALAGPPSPPPPPPPPPPPHCRFVGTSVAVHARLYLLANSGHGPPGPAAASERATDSAGAVPCRQPFTSHSRTGLMNKIVNGRYAALPEVATRPRQLHCWRPPPGPAQTCCKSTLWLLACAGRRACARNRGFHASRHRSRHSKSKVNGRWTSVVKVCAGPWDAGVRPLAEVIRPTVSAGGLFVAVGTRALCCRRAPRQREPRPGTRCRSAARRGMVLSLSAHCAGRSFLGARAGARGAGTR